MTLLKIDNQGIREFSKEFDRMKMMKEQTTQE
jgi:hypothetical protein